MSSCIYPGTMGGGSAYSYSFSAGFGGSPGRSTVRFVNKTGDYTKPELGTNNVLQVGVTGKLRPQVPVKYSIERSAQSSLLTVIFEDKSIVDLQKTIIFVAPIGYPAPPSTPCVISLGKIYHRDKKKPSGISNNMAAIPGPSPTYERDGEEIKESTEFMLFSAAEFAGAISHLIGAGLSAAIAGLNQYFDSSTDAMSLINSLAKKYKWELYANDKGQLDKLSATSGSAGNITNVGSSCSIVGMTESSDITNNFSQGGFVKYEHEDKWLDEREQRFRNIDFLALPLRACDSGDHNLSLYEPDMEETEKLHLKRFLKAVYLSKNWEDGWNGFQNYIFLKRAAGNGSKTVETDEIEITIGGSTIGSDTAKGKSMAEKKVIAGDLGTSRLENVYYNGVVDELFSCVSPLRLDLEDGTSEGIAEEVKKSFEPGNRNSKVDKAGPVNANGKKAILIVGPGDEGGGEEEVSDGGGKWSEGRNSEVTSRLQMLMSSLGRFWFMTGGGGGGGAGLIKEWEHGSRNYVMPRVNWFNKDLSARFSPFSQVYESIFDPIINKWNDNGGIVTNQDDVDRGKKPIKADPEDLSISQFLHLASKLKAVSVDGDAEEGDFIKTYEDAFLNGKGKTPEELKKEEEAALENCEDYDPDGLVLWDKGEQGFPIPDQNPALKSLAEGIEPNMDRLGNATVKALSKMYKLVYLINPSHGDIDTPREVSGIKAEDDETYDDVDGEIDAMGEGSVFDLIGKRIVETLGYTEERPREYSNSRSVSPSCEGKIYKVAMPVEDISGEVLRRDVDCFGNAKEWDKDWGNADSIAVIEALNAKISEMYYVNTDDQASTTVRTCGSEPANMPSAQQGLQGFNVELGGDGSVNTSFTVGGVARAAAFNANQGNKKGGRNGL